MKNFLWKAIMPLAMMLALQGCKKDEVGNCDDGKDNDKNGQTDCDDAACVADAACVGDVEVCDNGVDDDGDGDLDCNDADCDNAAGCIGGPCLADAECPGAGNDCLSETPDGFPAGYCIADCDPALGNADCDGGFCIDFGDGTGLCAADCTVATQADDCRDGYSCQDLGDGIQFACLPACTSDDQCLDEGNICLDNGACGLDPAIACSEAAVLNLGTTTGDLTGGVDGLTGSCQLGGSAEDIFTFTPAAGQVGSAVVFTLDSATDLGIFALADCEDPASEIDCVDNLVGGSAENLILDIANTNPITIVVDGFAAGEEGPYTLTVAAVVCGDGLLVAGVETCDDGNTAAGDGCDAVCAIEDGFACDNTVAPSVCNLIVCGDGLVQGAEECDDNNTAAGDGCDAVCAEELGFLCQGEPSVCVDLNLICANDSINIPDITAVTTGDTTGGSEVFNGSCTGGGAEQIFSLVPGAAGQSGTLTVVLTSATDLGVYARTTCADDATELDCADAAFPGNPNGNVDTETLVVSISDGSTPVSIFVDSFVSGDEGTFSMTTTFVTDVCGDGVVSGGEACDDINGTPIDGDGCSALCTVEPGFVCAGSPSVCTDLNPTCDAATPAVIGDTTGDTTGGTTLFIGPAAQVFEDCPFDGVGGGAEVLFSFTPAADGNLVLTLVSASDLGVYVRTTCADDTTIIGCADEAFPGEPNGNETTENTTIAVTGGVPLTIFVDAFDDVSDGPFTLTLQ